MHYVVSRENMVIFHIKVVAIIVLLHAAFPIMTGIDVNPAIKDMHGRICHIITRNQVSHFFFHIQSILKIKQVILFFIREQFFHKRFRFIVTIKKKRIIMPAMYRKAVFP